MQRPNIVVIMTDQQSRHMMSCTGNAHLETPAMDSLAAEGVLFDRAYCTNPVCVPSRFSLFTGRMPSEIGLFKNGRVNATDEHLQEVVDSGMGWTLKAAGYDAIYAGKQHLPKMNAEDLGFDVLTHDERDECARLTADYVSRPHDKPYCLVASFINPHDICYMAIREHADGEQQQRIMQHASTELEELDAALASAEIIHKDEFWGDRCPPLPPNHEPQAGEPQAVGGLLEQRQFRKNARLTWDERTWRMHRWAYHRLTERVDGQVGILLDALRQSPDWDNTVVIFTSDHGDHDSSHGLEHKTVPYEEAAGVPFIVRTPGGPAGVVDSHLVSNGLDLYATVCDYAGTEPPPHLTGLSIRPLAEAQAWDASRVTVPVECEIGRMVVGERHKYLKCFEGHGAEQLYDLHADPHETRNAIDDPGWGDDLDYLKEAFAMQFGDIVV